VAVLIIKGIVIPFDLSNYLLSLSYNEVFSMVERMGNRRDYSMMLDVIGGVVIGHGPDIVLNVVLIRVVNIQMLYLL